MKLGDPTKASSTGRSIISDRAKIVLMGVLLGVILLVYLLPDRAAPTGKPVIERPPAVDVSVYRPDAKVLAEVKDSTTLERGTGLKVSVLFHLLSKTYNIGPAASAGLGLPKTSADIRTLRAHPELHRGEYLWLKGRLEKFEQQKLHPIRRAKSYKGRLRTAEGDPVIFWVSNPLPESIRDQDKPWVRVEGFFVKIVDEHYVDDKVVNAPLIVGPKVREAFPDWEPVTKIDPTILDPKKNAVFIDGGWVHGEGAGLYLEDSQDKSLWHLASFAMYEAARKADTEERNEEPFELKDQYTKFKTGGYDRGAPFRLRGTFVQARVFRADANPLGIDYWTAAWIQIPRLGAKMVPIWIPRDIGEWKFGDSVDVDAYYLRNRAYEALDSSVVHTPQFVAATLSRRQEPTHPIVLWLGLGFAVFVLCVSALFFRMNRAARIDSSEYKDRLIRRRRNRRTSTAGNLSV